MRTFYQKICGIFCFFRKSSATEKSQASSATTRQSPTDTPYESDSTRALEPVILSSADHVKWPTPPPSTEYPKWPPPSPRELMANPEWYESMMAKRGWNKLPKEEVTDNSLYALYRLYEHLVLNHRYGIRNEIEYFWSKDEWAVADIQDPKDSDLERYAVLSCIPYLLVEAFNENIGRGMPRGAPAVISDDLLVELNAQEKKFEEVPPWARLVPALATPLNIILSPRRAQTLPDLIPGEDIDLGGLKNDERLSPSFKKKNITICHPHIKFI
ncbi:hypothetical protein BDZ45DRAFT_52102 [Acephala macrosclerotiorum]|nr:hypothetical protein BDZ45DRAFT_52102 [Acephala macrosclerotiorum]